MPIFELPTLARIAEPKALADAYNSLAPFFQLELGDNRLDLASHNLHWYMAGDLQEWWETLRKHGPVRVLPAVPRSAWNALAGKEPVRSLDEARAVWDEIGTSRLGEADLSGAAGGRSFLICQADQLVGHFIRALPSLAMASFAELLVSDFDFDLVALEERESMVESAWRLVALAERVWPTL